MDEEIQHLSNSATQLRIAASKYIDSKEAISALSGSKGKTLLVPLTGSLYVTGSITDEANVVVDIGTGYYVQKTAKDAQDFADRKVKYINEQISKVQQAVNIKRNNLDVVLGVMQQKILAMQQ